MAASPLAFHIISLVTITNITLPFSDYPPSFPTTTNMTASFICHPAFSLFTFSSLPSHENYPPCSFLSNHNHLNHHQQRHSRPHQPHKQNSRSLSHRAYPYPDTHLEIHPHDPHFIILPLTASWVPRLIACDCDGTLLTSKHVAHPNAEQAIVKAQEKGILFIPATGKSRAGALKSMGKSLAERLNDAGNGACSGVFLQGLIVYGLNNEIIYEQTCSEEISKRIIDYSRKHNITLIAYSGDRILCEKENERTDSIIKYNEPVPENVGSWETVLGNTPIHKFLYMDTVVSIDKMRPEVERLVGLEATVVQAMGDMLEVLPPGASKGKGLTHLLNYYQIQSQDVLALGDAENDIEMLKSAGVGAVVANGTKSAKAVADIIVRSNDEGGVADAIRQYCLGDIQAQLDGMTAA